MVITYCDFMSELGDHCSFEAQHFYQFQMNELASIYYTARCNNHEMDWRKMDEVSEQEYLVGQVMER